jgi:hypothetical protein
MWSTLLTLWRGRFGKSLHQAPRRNVPFCPFLEMLENRRVPASLSYSSYLPSTAYAIAVDSSGEAFMAGSATNGGAYVARLNSSGTALAYLTDLGSGGSSNATGIALDSLGDAYVTGWTNSNSYPTTGNAAFQSGAAFPGGNTQAGFVTELSPTGSILYSTYLPGVGGIGATATEGPALALDGSDNVYVTGGAGTGLPTTAGAFQAAYTGAPGAGNTQAFLTVLNPSLSGTAGLLYVSYLGGSSGADAGTGVAVDAGGNACLTGYTGSSNFPTTTGAFQTTYSKSEDAFVAKFNPTLSGPASLLWSSYLGGSGTDGYISDNHAVIMPGQTGPGIAVDSAGNLYVTGSTSSGNFPTTAGAFQTRLANPAGRGVTTIDSDAFVCKINPAGTALVYWTYLGGNNLDGGSSIVVDSSGNAYVTGWTRSGNFPLKNPIQAQKAGGTDQWGQPNADVFVTVLNSSGSGLLFSTCLGGLGDDYGFGIALDPATNAYVAGQTIWSSAGKNNFPTTAGAYQTTAQTELSGLVFKIDPPAEEAPAAPSTNPNSLPVTYAPWPLSTHQATPGGSYPGLVNVPTDGRDDATAQAGWLEPTVGVDLGAVTPIGHHGDFRALLMGRHQKLGCLLDSEYAADGNEEAGEGLPVG